MVAEDAFGEQMLDEHLFHLCLGEVRINGCFALLMKILKGGVETDVLSRISLLMTILQRRVPAPAPSP